MSNNLGVRVLPHTIKKPGCSSTVIDFFSTTHRTIRISSTSTHISQAIKPSELIVVGDRVFTDVLMANSLGSLSVWTTGLWERELMPMRYIEYGIVGVLDSWARRKSSKAAKLSEAVDGGVVSPEPSPQDLFVRILPPPPPPPPSRLLLSIRLLRRGIAMTSRGIVMSYHGLVTASQWATRQYRVRLKPKPAADAIVDGEIVLPPGPPFRDPRPAIAASRCRGSIVKALRLDWWAYQRL